MLAYTQSERVKNQQSSQVVFRGSQNVFGVPKPPIGIQPSKVGQNR